MSENATSPRSPTAVTVGPGVAERPSAPLSRRVSRLHLVGKRTLDLVIGSLALVLAIPVLAIAALAIVATSPGPVFFRQERVGRGGKPFTLWKLRTMHVDTDDSAHRAYVRAMFTGDEIQARTRSGLQKLDDARITRVGGVLRRTSIDELPQLINVLLGQMSLVGPRPALPWEVELFGALGRLRSEVKPGITGLWQVSGRSRLTMREALELDCAYAQQRSVLLDLKILVSTVPVVLARRDVA
jgi:lipopolysaccharide/colanic/teichoic acid biosynthesis glycosyltransferase